MSGPQEWDEPDRSDQPGPRDATIDLSPLVERVQRQVLVEQNGGSNGRRNGPKHSAALAQRPEPWYEPGQQTTTGSGPPSLLDKDAGPFSLLNGDLGAPGPPSEVASVPETDQVVSTPEPDQQVSQPARSSVRPSAGSLDDLRQRLELLPFGHPSSPYHVDGERRPDPPRLKHLELAPPPVRSRLGEWPGSTQHATSHADEDDAYLWPDHHSLDVPLQAGAVPAGPGGSIGAVELPPAIPHIEADGTWTLGPARLTSDQVRIADEAYDRFRAAEGRSLFGSYGSGGLTTTLRHIEEGLDFGRLAPDTEQRALLEADAFKARFADQLRRNPDRLPEQLARRVPGALSYSFIFDAERYSAGIWIVQDAIGAQGFRLLARRNGWTSAADKCVVTVWHDPLHDLPFQVQFHTSASLEAQQLARTSATLINDPRIPRVEAVNLQADLAAAWAALPAPPGNSQIEDYDIETDGA